MHRIRPSVFYPSFVLLTLAVCATLLPGVPFTAWFTSANDWVLDFFGSTFSVVTGLMLLVCILIPFTPFGKIRIGGASAKPFLSKGRWFAIVLCTTIATGILFWGTAEPLYHYTTPPEGSGFAPNSLEALQFSLTTLFLHWSFSPYAIYTVPALLFAVGYYNRRGAFSIVTMLQPIAGMREHKRLGSLIDSLALFGLVMGMSAALGAGVLTLKGGIKQLFAFEISDSLLVGMIAISIVAAFTASAATGLFRGIKNLSLINLVAFVLLLIFVMAAGSSSVFETAMKALLDLPVAIARDSFSAPVDVNWSHDWTTFYWANWMAWAPVTALFLGRLAYGRTVREFMWVNWALPSLFAILWMTVIGGNVLHAEHFGMANFTEVLQNEGPEGIVYALFALFPFGAAVTLFFVLTTFLSYTTAADSNTEAMGGISTSGISPEQPSPPVFIKVVWGTLIGAVAVVSIGTSGLDGIRMLSNLGGLPALLLLIACLLAMLKLMWQTR